MPLIDSDTVIVRRATRTGTNQAPTNIEVEIEWKDSAGVSKGVFTTSWATFQELKDFMDGQGFDDVLRAVMGQCLRRDDGAFRPAQFNALSGTTNTVNVRVTRV